MRKILVRRDEEFTAVRIITGLGYRILENHYDPTLDRIVLTIENAWKDTPATYEWKAYGLRKDGTIGTID